MMGVSTARTAAALDPRSARISVRSRSRIRWIAATDGLISITAPYRRTLNPRKSNPVESTRDRYTIRGYVSTAAKHGLNTITVLRDALLGRPWIPDLPVPT